MVLIYVGVSEPAVGEYDKSDSNTLTSGENKQALLLEMLQNDFNEMINSVKKYGGFYVGRYETSMQDGKIKSVKTTNVNDIYTAGTTKAKNWYGLYSKLKAYANENGMSDELGSSMIWGCAYDQIMLWMQENDINVKDTSKTQGNFGDSYINTGSNVNYEIQNIYDLCGNYQEWTVEMLWGGRAARGGSKSSGSDFVTLSSRENRPPSSGFEEITSRIQLFIKGEGNNSQGGTDTPVTPNPPVTPDDPDKDDPDKLVDDKGYLLSNYTYASSSNANLKITIPKGFALMNIEGTQIITDTNSYSTVLTDDNLLNQGIVVQAKDESEFVWIPVTNTTGEGTNNMYWLKDAKKVGQVYLNNSGNEFGGPRTQYQNNGGISEPSVVGSDAGDLSVFQSEFNNMIDSVIAYGGFYVGRYETSSISSKVKSVPAEPSQILTAAKESDGGTGSWYGLYSKIANYATDAGVSNDVTSCMIWGCAYDQIMLWMQASGINVKNTDKTQGNFGSNFIKTGSKADYKIQNIYDLCGNYQEWTMTCLWSGRAARGGHKGSGESCSSISSGDNRPVGQACPEITSRIQLYLKVK